MRLLTVVGARPQFIKASVVSAAIEASDSIDEILLDTGQHYDDNMSRLFFEELELAAPDVALGVGSGPHGAQTAAMLSGVEGAILDKRPDAVAVYGDTNSTLAGALAAAKVGVPLAHVEAGLRSFDMSMPEEVNRRVTDHVSDMLFAPTSTAVANLESEQVMGRVLHVGDVMFDASLRFGPTAETKSDVLTRLELESTPFVLATVHRAGNTDDGARLGAIVAGLGQVAERIGVVFPVHPRTQKSLDEFGIQMPDGVVVTEPLGYLDTLMLESRCDLVVTDSGGLQKEAFFHGRPCVTLRAETEWEELVELGWVRLADPISPEVVSAAVFDALAAGPGSPGSPYGDGTAGEKIVKALVETYG
jgi:UDP-GlcNAc3NAcA epimerase